jgi:hypothetical protein
MVSCPLEARATISISTTGSSSNSCCGHKAIAEIETSSTLANIYWSILFEFWQQQQQQQQQPKKQRRRHA